MPRAGLGWVWTGAPRMAGGVLGVGAAEVWSQGWDDGAGGGAVGRRCWRRDHHSAMLYVGVS
jgi:DhnA family fructose-bisphosphate aldolase class Ia